MAKQLTELTVFISCPGDLEAERQVVESCLQEANQLLREAYGVLLRTIVWDRDVVPGIGTDAQTVISSQVDPKYDIYIGLLGTRFGTPTSRAGSGTEEEFLHAYERYSSNPESARVLFYFKLASDNVFRIDLGEVQKVRDFRERLENSGVLYKDFSDKDALLKIMKEHIRLLISEQWDGDKWKVISRAPCSSVSSFAPPLAQAVGAKVREIVEVLGPEAPDEDASGESQGILDSLVAGQAAIASSVEALGRLAKLMERLTENTNLRVYQMNAGTTNSDPVKLKQAVDDSAADLFDYSRDAKKEMVTFETSFAEALDSIEAIVAFCFGEGIQYADQVIELPATLGGLLTGMRVGRQSMDEFERL